MRPLLVAALACVFAACSFLRADAAPPTSLKLTANRVRFFSDRYVLTADGNVRVRLSDGSTISGQTFAMDLRLNRYVIAGDVHFTTRGGVHAVGAAFAGYPDLDRSYFLPADGSTPDRITYFGTDWSDPHAGREQPGDAFYLPDLTDHRPYIVAKGAMIFPRSSIVFDEAAVRAVGIAYVPTPRYVVTFSQNSHFFENAYVGARFNIAEPFYGTQHSLSELDVRNDLVNGTYLAFQQHFVWDKAYIAFSIDPLTQEERQYNLIGYDRPSKNLEFRTFDQLTEGQPNLIEDRPISGASYESFQTNIGLRGSGLNYSLDQYNYDVLGIANPGYDNLYFPLQLEHPIDMSLNWTGFEHPLEKTGPLEQVKFRLRSGFGYAHDQYGEGGAYADFQDPHALETLYYKYLGGSIYATVPLKGGFTVTGRFDKQRTYYSIPHHFDQTDTSASLAHPFLRNKLNVFLTEDINNTGDFWGARQTEEYSTYTSPTTAVSQTYQTIYGQTYYPTDFDGFATTRTTQLGVVYTPTTYFGFNVQMEHLRNYPSPVIGLFGVPPYELTTTVHFRISPNLAVDVSRAYYFHFGGLNWSPSLGVQFAP